MFYSAKISVTIGSKTKDELPEWVTLTPPISMNMRKRKKEKKKNLYFF